MITDHIKVWSDFISTFSDIVLVDMRNYNENN